MTRRDKTAIVCLVMLTLLTVPCLSALGASPGTGPVLDGGTRAGSVIDEVGDETQSWRNARELVDGDTYMGHVDRVTDRADHFTVTAAQHQEVNVHVYLLGHDGVDEWLRPPATTPPSPPTPPRASAMLDCFIYHDPASDYPLDGAYNYYYVRHYMLNIVAPVPGTHTYHVNVSLDWAWTPNNLTWDYSMEVEVGSVPEITTGQAIDGLLDMAGRDTRWYRVWADAGRELNGSFQVLNFETGDPGSRNVDVWVFPDDLGGYPRALSWDWSAAPNEPVEPFSVLATYGGYYYIKLRGMNHEDVLPCSYRLYTLVQDVPQFPATGVQNAYFDRHWHDTDWYSIDMRADQEHPEKPGLWNEVQYFNMTERADAEDLPDFDLYLFAQVPGGRYLDLLDSSFRNDHADFLDPDRDPNRNTEHVSAAALYTGTYYLEVNAWNNTGYYDLRREFKQMEMSDGNNLPEEAEAIGPGRFEGYIHQSRDHYDWFTVEVDQVLTVEFDSFKAFDMFNLSILRYDSVSGEYRLLRSDWNTHFNITSRSDEITHLIRVVLDLDTLGLGPGTYHIAIYAAVATGVAQDPISGRPYVYVTDGEAEAHYELRVSVDGVLDPDIETVPIPPDTVEEDADLLDHVDLSEHFIPSFPDTQLRYKARLIEGKGRIILEGGMLGFRSAEDYSGRVVVRIMATTPSYLQKHLDWTIDLVPVNDPPRSRVAEPPLVFTMPEDSIRTLDLRQWVYDVDEGDTMTAIFGTTEHVSIDLDPDTLTATLVGDQDWFGEETVEVTFMDAQGATLVLPVRFVVENVADAPVLIEAFDRVTILEDTSASIPLYEHIVDPDGDPLTVFVSEDPFVVYGWDAETGVLTLVPEADWYGGRLLWITAIDPEGHRLQASLWLEVENVPGSPQILTTTPEATQVTVSEGSEQTFAVLEVFDEESSVLIYRWYVDGQFVGPSVSFTYRPGLHDQGSHEVKVVVEDEDGLTNESLWTVEVLDVPHSPDGGIATPPDGARFSEGEPVPFVAFYYDPDGDDLRYAWYIDGDHASDEAVFERRLDAGDHKVTLHVSSDGDSVTEELDVVVVQDVGGTPLGTILAIAILAVVVVIAMALLVRRRRP